MPIISSRNIHIRFLSKEDADMEQSNLFKKLSDINEGAKPIKKKYFLKSICFLIDAKTKFLIVSKVISFQEKIQIKFQHLNQNLK